MIGKKIVEKTTKKTIERSKENQGGLALKIKRRTAEGQRRSLLPKHI